MTYRNIAVAAGIACAALALFMLVGVVVHLSKEIMPIDGRQFIFIERAYTAIRIPMEDSHDDSEPGGERGRA
jgi:hypothetical protein